MAHAPFSLVAVKDEIVNDPLGLGYKNSPAPTDWKGDSAIAVIMNNSDGNNPRTVTNHTADTAEIRSSVTFDGFDGLVTSEESWFKWLTVNGSILVNDEMLQKLAGVPVATDSIWATSDRAAMNAAMIALFQFQGGRSQEVWNRLISAGDVGGAFNQI